MIKKSRWCFRWKDHSWEIFFSIHILVPLSLQAFVRFHYLLKKQTDSSKFLLQSAPSHFNFDNQIDGGFSFFQTPTVFFLAEKTPIEWVIWDSEIPPTASDCQPETDHWLYGQCPFGDLLVGVVLATCFISETLFFQLPLCPLIAPAVMGRWVR